MTQHGDEGLATELEALDHQTDKRRAKQQEAAAREKPAAEEPAAADEKATAAPWPGGVKACG